MEKKLYDLQIDQEFAKMARPLTNEENTVLTEDILEHGCLAALVVWNGIIVDGHNRYRICHEHHILFGIEPIEFSDRAEAKIWIFKNQIARRNVTKFERCEMALEIEPDLQAENEDRRRELISKYQQTGETAPKSAASMDTRDILAAMAGVGHNMIDMVRFIIPRVDDKTKDSLRQNKVSINKVYKDLRGKPETKEEPDQKVLPDNPHQPVSFIDHPTEDPVTHREPEREQGSYQFVKDQVEFAIRNMIADMKVGVYCLSNKDFDKKKELKAILREGYKQAADIIDRLEKL